MAFICVSAKPNGWPAKLTVLCVECVLQTALFIPCETGCLITAGLADIVLLIPARVAVTRGLY